MRKAVVFDLGETLMEYRGMPLTFGLFHEKPHGQYGSKSVSEIDI